MFFQILVKVIYPPVNRYLLLGADVIVHESEVSIWGDEGEDTLRLPPLEPHTRVETHIIKNTRILY